MAGGRMADDLYPQSLTASEISELRGWIHDSRHECVHENQQP